jgi:hypothetical protein
MRRSGPDGTRFSPAEDDAVRSRPRANFPVWTATLPASARNRALGFRVERLRRGRVLEDFCEAQSRIVQRCARCSDSLEAAISLCRSRGGAIFFFEKCAILFLKIKLRAILHDRLLYSDPSCPSPRRNLTPGSVPPRNLRAVQLRRQRPRGGGCGSGGGLTWGSGSRAYSARGRSRLRPIDCRSAAATSS